MAVRQHQNILPIIDIDIRPCGNAGLFTPYSSIGRARLRGRKEWWRFESVCGDKKHKYLNSYFFSMFVSRLLRSPREVLIKESEYLSFLSILS